MASIWVESLGRSFERALDLLTDAVQECVDELWETPMWQVPEPAHPFLGADWKPVTDPEQHNALVQGWIQRWSTPWAVAWHTLETFDYDLTGELGPWLPPPPFLGHPHWRDLPSLPAAWSKAEILGYIDYCRHRVRNALEAMTDEKAATPLPSSHRYSGQPHAALIAGMVVHTTEHASQIRQFITAAGAAAGT